MVAEPYTDDGGTVTPDPRRDLWRDYLRQFGAGKDRQRARTQLNTRYDAALGGGPDTNAWKRYLSTFGGGDSRQAARGDLRSTWQANGSQPTEPSEPKFGAAPDIWKQYLSTLQAGDERSVARNQLRMFYSQAKDDESLVDQYLSLLPAGDIRRQARADFFGRNAPEPTPEEPAPEDPTNPFQDELGATNWSQVLEQLGLPLDAIFEQQRNALQSQLDFDTLQATNLYDTGVANADLQNLLANRQIDENMAARGLFGSGIERRDERLQNQAYTGGLLDLLQNRDLATMQAQMGFHGGMGQAILDLASRSMQDPYVPIPDWYSWMKDNPVG